MSAAQVGCAAPVGPAEITLLVACARNGVIGRDNALPWHLPEDLRHFRATTLGHVLIMGRRTFESIGRPLPGRYTIVLTRDPAWRADGCVVARNLDDAIAAGRAARHGEIFVVGGEQVYRAALSRADRILMTLIERDVPGDAFFPALDERTWRPAHRDPRVADDGTAFAIIDWRPRVDAADTAPTNADRR